MLNEEAMQSTAFLRLSSGSIRKNRRKKSKIPARIVCVLWLTLSVISHISNGFAAAGMALTSYNVVALVSGGKDSTLNMMRCIEHGHKIVALANIFPAPGENDELDSFMYQTVGHDGIEAIARSMELPMFRRPTRGGRSKCTDLEYTWTAGDEVEDLFVLLKFVKMKMPHVNAVASGAILSNYQRTRVELICQRLGLVSLAFLWQGDQKLLLDEMIDSGIDAVLVKVACMGLGQQHIGKSLSQVRPILHRLNRDFGCHICGEGGEFETFTLDCPLYKQRIVIESTELILHQDDDVAPVAFLRLSNIRLAPKNPSSAESVSLPPPPVSADICVVTDADAAQLQDLPAAGCGAVSAAAAGVTRQSGPDGAVQAGSDGRVWRMHPARAADDAGGGVGDQAEAALARLSGDVEGDGTGGWGRMALVGVYLRDMADFGAVNAVYARHVPLRCPPARLCVGLPLRRGAAVRVEGVEARGAAETLHVQSVSGWAPCNIGPYSQAKTLPAARAVLVSGQIGLRPAAMALADGAAAQAAQCVANLAAVLAACRAGLRRCFRVTAFVTDTGDVRDVLAAWDHGVGSDEGTRRGGVTSAGVSVVQVRHVTGDVTGDVAGDGHVIVRG
jgi:diphthine-ammonia ligase